MTTPHPHTPPCLLYANRRGEIRELPELYAAGRSGFDLLLPEPADWIPLPRGSELFVLPGRLPVGIDPTSKEPLLLNQNPDDPGEGIQAVAAFMAPAHTATFGAAFQKASAEAPLLPLFAYTAVGWHRGRFWVCGFRSDPDRRQEPGRFAEQAIVRETRRRLRRHPSNRLIQHLGKCCLSYRCPAAINFFMDRFEAPLPSSPVCNARCLGCISLQPSGCCPATQERITFVPSPQEIAEIAAPHLARTGHVASFGQGCEGEPLLQAETLAKAIGLIRDQTRAGTINLNSNASLPRAVDRLAASGLDSIRVSLNSAREDYHRRYYRPQGFDLATVCRSIDIMKQRDRFVSLNYFILPGFSDDPAEFAALGELIEKHRPDFIQLRNLNLDPDWYLEEIGFAASGPPLGIRRWLTRLRKAFPWLGFGYFNPVAGRS